MQLQEIIFEGFDIEDISPLAELPNLKMIDVQRSNVHDYYPLINSKSLARVITPHFSLDSYGTLIDLFADKNISIGVGTDH